MTDKEIAKDIVKQLTGFRVGDLVRVKDGARGGNAQHHNGCVARLSWYVGGESEGYGASLWDARCTRCDIPHMRLFEHEMEHAL